MNTKIIITIAVVAVILVVVGLRSGSNQPSNVASSPTAQETTGSQIIQSPVTSQGASAPVGQPSLDPSLKLTFKDYNGKTVNLADFVGKPLVINAWASWCPFCRQEIPDFVTAQKEFGDKVVIIAINRQESLTTAKGYTDTQGTSNGLVFLLDPSDSFYKSIGGFSMPETVFVDKNGNIADHKRGPMDINEIRQKISKIL